MNLQLKNIFSFNHQFKNQEKIILRDFLALERTKLANERTLLSYIRASLYLLLGGIAILQLDGFGNIKFIGYISLGLTILLLIIGIYRYIKLNGRLMAYYLQEHSSIVKDGANEIHNNKN